jgi:Xaa-Pro dipeptidase
MPSLGCDLNSYSRTATGMIRAMNLDYTERNPELGGLYSQHVETIRQRHDHALERAGASHAVIFSGAPKYAFLDDNSYPFRPNPHFVGWAPLTRLPLSYIVYTPGEKPVLVYYQPRDYWHPVPGTPDGYWTSQFDIRIVHELDDVVAHLPADREKCILIGEIEDAKHAFGIDRVNPTTAINILHFARGTAKTPYELACMRLAARRGVLGHLAASAAFDEGLSEFAIHQAFCNATRHAENELPYSTRTYSKGDERFSELVARMESLQEDLVSRIRAGVDYRELQIETHRLTAGVLVDAGLASGDPETLL